MKQPGIEVKSGFTLIELLIVVAIIAILAAIAVPNFLEAQTRSKVSRAKADLRTIKTGMESYHIDNNEYPRAIATYPFLYLYTYANYLRGYDTVNERDIGVWELTTPIAYLTSIPIDEFTKTNKYHTTDLGRLGYAYVNFDAMAREPFRTQFAYPPEYSSTLDLRLDWNSDAGTRTKYLLISSGPDYESNFPYIVNIGQWTTLRAMAERPRPSTPEVARPYIYDPTNGTVSRGDIYVAQ